MIKCCIPNVGEFTAIINSIPTFYQWSGYAKDLNEFINYNFLTTKLNEHTIYLCSSDNGVGLGDYLSTYVLKQGFISDIEKFYTSDYNFWFFQAWELCEPFYDSLPDWVQHMIDVFVRSGFIHVVDVDDESKLFCLIDFDLLENNGVAQIVVDEIKAYCEKDVSCFLKEQLEEYGDANEVIQLYNDIGSWGKKMLQKYVP